MGHLVIGVLQVTALLLGWDLVTGVLCVTALQSSSWDGTWYRDCPGSMPICMRTSFVTSAPFARRFVGRTDITTFTCNHKATLKEHTLQASPAITMLHSKNKHYKLHLQSLHSKNRHYNLHLQSQSSSQRTYITSFTCNHHATFKELTLQLSPVITMLH